MTPVDRGVSSPRQPCRPSAGSPGSSTRCEAASPRSTLGSRHVVPSSPRLEAPPSPPRPEKQPASPRLEKRREPMAPVDRGPSSPRQFRRPSSFGFPDGGFRIRCEAVSTRSSLSSRHGVPSSPRLEARPSSPEKRAASPRVDKRRLPTTPADRGSHGSPAAHELARGRRSSDQLRISASGTRRGVDVEPRSAIEDRDPQPHEFRPRASRASESDWKREVPNTQSPRGANRFTWTECEVEEIDDLGSALSDLGGLEMTSERDAGNAGSKGSNFGGRLQDDLFVRNLARSGDLGAAAEDDLEKLVCKKRPQSPRAGKVRESAEKSAGRLEWGAPRVHSPGRPSCPSASPSQGFKRDLDRPLSQENACCPAREALWNNVLSTVAKENDELFRRLAHADVDSPSTVLRGEVARPVGSKSPRLPGACRCDRSPVSHKFWR